jgi:hypothetical protein
MAATAATAKGLADGYARRYDQIIMSIPAGVLAHRPSPSTTRQSETLVTRVPLAPFIALVLVDLLYAALGIGLTITAPGRNVQGGQCYKPIVLKVGDAENRHGEDTRNADNAPPEQRDDTSHDV